MNSLRDKDDQRGILLQEEKHARQFFQGGMGMKKFTESDPSSRLTFDSLFCNLLTGNDATGTSSGQS